MQHLSRHNYGLPHCYAPGDDHFLNTRYLLIRYLNTKITPGNHNPVNLLENFIDIIDTFFVFNLGYDLYCAVVLIQHCLNINNILFRSHKGVSNEIQVILHSHPDEAPVFFSE